jgi:transposase
VPTSGHRSSVSSGGSSGASSGGNSGRAFAVVATRRIWSTADRQRIVGEATVPGVNASAVARRNGVALSLLYRWRKEAAAALAAQAAQPAPRHEGPRPSAASAFVPVALLAAPQLPVPPAAITSSQPSLIEITLMGGRTLRVSTDVDASALARIVAALEGKL